MLTAQSVHSSCHKVNTLINVLDKNHYDPVDLNDTLILKEIFNVFMINLDEDRIYFTQENRNELYTNCFSYGGSATDRLCSYALNAIPLFRERLGWADSIIGALEKNPANYTINDSLSFAPEQADIFCANNNELGSRWRRWIKYQTLRHFFSTEDSLQNAGIGELISSEPDMREKALNEEQCKIKKILSNQNGLEDYVTSAILNAIASVYDPHTSYFSPVDKTSYESSLSKRYFSFGLNVNEDPSGDIQIAGLVPGGPAWKTGELNKGDMLVQIRLENGQVNDLTCLNYKDVNELLESSTSENIELTVQKINGQLVTVKLHKEEMMVDGNAISSYVLNGDRKIGYICLPAFYTEYEESYPLGCANDLAKEILKLNHEKIEGLILDLRNNGGGSMTEALELAGIFINEGPLSIYRYKNDQFQVLKDLNRGTIYNGPLILLVNKFSASASEILAAALQDYHRALIVGTPTFGKASGQIVIPMDEDYGLNIITPKKSYSDIGYLKLTISRFYRVNGTTHQGKGVIPDIQLPEEFAYLDFSESGYSYAFPADTISRKATYKALDALPLKELASESKKRISTDSTFKEVIRINKLIKDYLDSHYMVPLDFESYKSRVIQRSEVISEIGHIGSHQATEYRVDNNQFDKDLIQLDGYKKEVNSLIINELQKDAYVEESYRILDDLIQYMNY